MVSISCMGGLGNNLFQICALLSHSLKYGYDYRVPLKINNPHYAGQTVYQSPKIKYSDENSNIKEWHEKDFTYQEIPAIDNVCLYGYWQSWRYSAPYIDEIRRLLNFDCETKKNVVAVHVRLTNYTQLKNFHPPVSDHYLNTAIEYVRAKNGWQQLKFYSDDISWCRMFAKKNGYESADFAEGKNEVEDFQDLINCSSFITANSSYSLCAAMLNNNPDKIVVSPLTWFGPDAKNNSTIDLYLPNSTIL